MGLRRPPYLPLLSLKREPGEIPRCRVGESGGVPMSLGGGCSGGGGRKSTGCLGPNFLFASSSVGNENVSEVHRKYHITTSSPRKANKFESHFLMIGTCFLRHALILLPLNTHIIILIKFVVTSSNVVALCIQEYMHKMDGACGWKV